MFVWCQEIGDSRPTGSTEGYVYFICLNKLLIVRIVGL
jgi:hypothetical protein